MSDDDRDLDAASEADRWIDEEASDEQDRRRRPREAESAQMTLPGMG